MRHVYMSLAYISPSDETDLQKHQLLIMTKEELLYISDLLKTLKTHKKHDARRTMTNPCMNHCRRNVLCESLKPDFRNMPSSILFPKSAFNELQRTLHSQW